MFGGDCWGALTVWVLHELHWQWFVAGYPVGWEALMLYQVCVVLGSLLLGDPRYVGLP
jgi:hypothetical protein